jgi:hypothetical protein
LEKKFYRKNHVGKRIADGNAPRVTRAPAFLRRRSEAPAK